jgi:hypothetical protein
VFWNWQAIIAVAVGLAVVAAFFGAVAGLDALCARRFGRSEWRIVGIFFGLPFVILFGLSILGALHRA